MTDTAISENTGVKTRHKQHAKDWIVKFARSGYAAKGVVYAIVGVLATMAAFGFGGDVDGTNNAIRAIGNQPFGRILLGVVAIALAGYVVWRTFQAVADPDDRGTDAMGLFKRAGLVVSALSYASLVYLAGRLALGSGGSSGGDSKQELTAMVLAQPFGQWMVGLVGATLIGVGLYHFYRAHKARFMKKYNKAEMGHDKQQAARRIGKFGIAARAVTFLIIGGFFIQTAIKANPEEAGGLGEALQTLAQQPFGPWILGIVAIGFVAYGAYCFSNAMYREFV